MGLLVPKKKNVLAICRHDRHLGHLKKIMAHAKFQDLGTSGSEEVLNVLAICGHDRHLGQPNLTCREKCQGQPRVIIYKLGRA